MAYVTKLNNGSQTLTIRDPEAIHAQQTGDGAFNPAADIAFTGADSFSQSPTVPTCATSDSSQKAASTAFVQNAIAAAGGGGGTVTVDHHYPIVTKTSVPCTLDDRSVNILALGSATTATINVPPAVDGKARDFWLILTTTATGTKTYTLAGGTFYGEDDTTFEIEVGETYPNVFVFTEFTAGKFAVSRRRFATESSTIH